MSSVALRPGLDAGDGKAAKPAVPSTRPGQDTFDQTLSRVAMPDATRPASASGPVSRTLQTKLLAAANRLFDPATPESSADLASEPAAPPNRRSLRTTDPVADLAGLSALVSPMPPRIDPSASVTTEDATGSTAAAVSTTDRGLPASPQRLDTKAAAPLTEVVPGSTPPLRPDADALLQASATGPVGPVQPTAAEPKEGEDSTQSPAPASPDVAAALSAASGAPPIASSRSLAARSPAGTQSPASPAASPPTGELVATATEAPSPRTPGLAPLALGDDRSAIGQDDTVAEATPAASPPEQPSPMQPASQAGQQVLTALLALAGSSPTATADTGSGAQQAGAPAAAPDAARQPAAGGTHAVTIMLDPEHLGAVSIKIRMLASRVDIQIQVSNARTLALLDKDRHVLSAAVANLAGRADALALTALPSPDHNAPVVGSPGQQTPQNAASDSGAEPRTARRPSSTAPTGSPDDETASPPPDAVHRPRGAGVYV